MGAWCSQDSRRMLSPSLRGQTRGSDTGQPPSTEGEDTGAQKHSPLIRHRGHTAVAVSLKVTPSKIFLTCFRSLCAGVGQNKHLKPRCLLPTIRLRLWPLAMSKAQVKLAPVSPQAPHGIYGARCQGKGHWKCERDERRLKGDGEERREEGWHCQGDGHQAEDQHVSVLRWTNAHTKPCSPSGLTVHMLMRRRQRKGSRLQWMQGRQVM